MIYCVVPCAFEEELFEKLSAYYRGDPNVEVIVDRRAGERRGPKALREGGDRDGKREQRDRRRQRITGEFPPLEQP